MEEGIAFDIEVFIGQGPPLTARVVVANNSDARDYIKSIGKDGYMVTDTKTQEATFYPPQRITLVKARRSE